MTYSTPAGVVIVGLLALLGRSFCQAPPEKRLTKFLLENYEAAGIYGRPTRNLSQPIDVTQGFSLVQVTEFDQHNQILTIVGWEFMRWKDSLLTWEPDAFDDCTSVVVPSESIWTPDIVLFNALDRPIKIHDPMAHVTSEGQVTWVTQKQYKVSCVTNPDQTDPKCLLKFGSWTMNNDKINLVTSRDKIDAGYYVAHIDWELGRTKAVKSRKEYPCCDGEYFSDITYSIALHLRNPQPDESNQDLGGTVCPRISALLLYTSALLLGLL